MMIPVVDKFLDLLMRFSRDRKYSLSFLDAVTEEVDRMFLSPLASAFLLPTGAAGQSERAPHKIRKFGEEPFFA